MKTIYIYKLDIMSYDLDVVEEYIAENETYMGEEGLMYLFENEIDIIEDMYDLLEWCKENDYTLVDIYDEFGLNLKEWLNNVD